MKPLKFIENTSTGVVFFAVLAILAVIGFGFFEIILGMFAKIGIGQVITYAVIGLVGLMIIFTTMLVLYATGDTVNSCVFKNGT